jgi:hypothetical protein
MVVQPGVAAHKFNSISHTGNQGPSKSFIAAAPANIKQQASTATYAIDQQQGSRVQGGFSSAEGIPETAPLAGTASGFVKLPQEDTGRVYSLSNGNNGPSGSGSSLTSGGNNKNLQG